MKFCIIITTQIDYIIALNNGDIYIMLVKKILCTRISLLASLFAILYLGMYALSYIIV